MLVDIKEILSKARREGYWVCSTGPVFADLLPPIIASCEAARSPLILSVTESQMQYNHISEVGPALVRGARRASIPVAVILDHGKSMEVVGQAIRIGFNAVMFDGSDLPLEENIERTANVCRMARHFGVAVEGEIGQIGGAEGVPAT